MKEIKIQGSEEIIYEHKNKSGLNVYIWPYQLSEEISMTLTIKYGSIHTDFKIGNKRYQVPNGVAHFLEHVKFNEKKDFTAHDYYYKIGSYTNAYTTYDHTSYEVMCNENLKDNLEHLLYFVLNPYFTKGLIQKEKSIIVEEAKSRLDDPYSIGYFKLLNGLYKKNKVRNLVTGNPEDIKKTTLDDIETVFKAFYHPENMFLTITGNVNPEEVIAIVDDYFENTSVGEFLKPEIIKEKEPDSVCQKHQELLANVKRDKVFYAIKVPKTNFPKMPKNVLSAYLGLITLCNFGDTSEFREELFKNKLVDELDYTKNVDDDHVTFSFIASSECPNEVLAKIKEKLNNLAVDEKTFRRKIKNYIVGIILAYEEPTYVNEDIRMEVVKYDKVINNTYEIIKKLDYDKLNKIIKCIKNYTESEVILKAQKNS